jgi:hypothetical protein
MVFVRRGMWLAKNVDTICIQFEMERTYHCQFVKAY